MSIYLFHLRKVRKKEKAVFKTIFGLFLVTFLNKFQMFIVYDFTQHFSKNLSHTNFGRNKPRKINVVIIAAKVETSRKPKSLILPRIWEKITW